MGIPEMLGFYIFFYNFISLIALKFRGINIKNDNYNKTKQINGDISYPRKDMKYQIIMGTITTNSTTMD